eukprot:4516934-Amphidinium_carterae.1
MVRSILPTCWHKRWAKAAERCKDAHSTNLTTARHGDGPEMSTHSAHEQRQSHTRAPWRESFWCYDE